MRRRSAGAAAGVVVVLGLLAGCSGDTEEPVATSTSSSTAATPSGSSGAASPSPTATTASPTATAGATPTPTVTVAGASARERYLALAAPYNEAFFAANTEAERPSPDMAEVRALSADAAAALARFVADLRATRWPADVEPAAQALARSAEADIPGWRASAAATSMEDWRAVRFPPEDGAPARMREALGLPPVPTG